MSSKYTQLQLLLVILALSLLAACGGSEIQPPRPTLTLPPTRPTVLPTPTPLPEIDVIIVGIELPSRVNRSQEFEYIVTVKNNLSTGPTAGLTNVEIRAQITDASGATDIPFGGTVFRNLEPNKPQQATVRGTSPSRPGLWTIHATVVPFNYIDTVNNAYEISLVVD